MQPETIFLLITGAAFVMLTMYAVAAIGGIADDDERWKALLEEMNKRYPHAIYSAKLEFMRRELYAALKHATGKDEDIAYHSEDYQLIIQEQERIAQAEKELGAEFDPYVANQFPGER